MYFLLTGRHVPAMIAAQGDNAHFIVARNARVTPPREINSAIPAGLERTVLLCLEKEPIARPSCVEEVLAHLLATRDLFVS